MSRTDSIRALKRGWWIVLLGLVVALIGAAFFTRRQPSVYRASTLMAVTPNSEVEGTTNILRSLETLERRTIVATFAKIPSATQTRSDAGAELEMGARELRRYRISGSVLPNTNILRIDVTGPDSDKAAQLANEAAVVTQEAARSMYRIYTLRPLAEAEPAGRPIHPDPERNYTVAGLLGVFLGLLAAFVLELLRSASKPST